MPLVKHVVEEVQIPIRDAEGTVIRIETEMQARDVEMTPEEEKEFLATLPPQAESPIDKPATKDDLMTQLARIQKQIEALP